MFNGKKILKTNKKETLLKIDLTFEEAMKKALSTPIKKVNQKNLPLNPKKQNNAR